MGGKLLIVDDEPDIRDILAEYFQGLGMWVATAGSGEEALAILEHESIPVLLLDLHMPGMNGLDLCRAIRRRKNPAQILAFTGYHRLFSPQTASEAGFDGYLHKPVDLEHLRRVVSGALEKAREDGWVNQR